VEVTTEQLRALAMANARMRADTAQPEPAPSHVELPLDLRASMDAGPVESDPGPGIMRTAAQFMRAASNGLTFNNTDRIAAGLNAAFGNGDYASNLAGQRKESSRFAREHPFWDSTANVAGSMVLPIGVVGAAANRGTLLGKTVTGMGVGSVMGGAAGAGASPDWTDLKQLGRDTSFGMGTGAVLGGSIPLASKGIGSGVNVIANAMRGRADGMSRGASKPLVSAMEADGPAAVRANLDKYGPDAMLVDAGPAFLGKGQGTALLSDEGRAVMTNNLGARDKGTNSRIMGDVERAMGPAEDPFTVTKNILDRRMKVDNENYPRVLENAPEIRTTPMMRELEGAISHSANGGMEKKALLTLKGMLMRTEKRARVDSVTGRQEYDARGRAIWDDVPVNETRADVLHKVKGEIDQIIEHDLPGLGVPAGALRNQQFALKKFRHQLNELLEQQVDGYARANRVSSALANRAEAVEKGTQYLGEGKTTPSPGRFQDEFEQLTMGERIALAKGSRSVIDRKLGTKANDLQALRGELQGEGGWNTEKIGIVHGEDAAKQLMDTVERNLKFRDTHTKVVENSQTEIRRSAREAMKPTTGSDKPLIEPGTTITGFIGTVGKKAIQSIAKAMRADPTRAYGEVAEILTRQGASRDQAVEAIIDALERRSGNKAISSMAGDRSALAASIAANALLTDRMRRPQP
jgi:hypothetical protein